MSEVLNEFQICVKLGNKIAKNKPLPSVQKNIVSVFHYCPCQVIGSKLGFENDCFKLHNRYT